MGLQDCVRYDKGERHLARQTRLSGVSWYSPARMIVTPPMRPALATSQGEDCATPYASDAAAKATTPKAVHTNRYAATNTQVGTNALPLARRQRHCVSV